MEGGVRRELALDGRRVTVHERGHGRPLVCLPGGPGFPAAQLGDLGGLTAARRLLVPDWRGAGDSDPPADGLHTLAAYVADLDLLRDALGLQQMDLFGHSFGGAVATAYAAEQPERVSRLVLDGSPDRLDDGRAPTGEGLAGFFATWNERARAYAEPLMESIYEPALEAFEPEWATTDLRPLFPRITAPTLVVTGDADWVCGPDRARTMVAALPAGRAVVLKDAGHFAWVEQPAAYVRAVEEFLAG